MYAPQQKRSAGKEAVTEHGSAVEGAAPDRSGQAKMQKKRASVMVARAAQFKLERRAKALEDENVQRNTEASPVEDMTEAGLRPRGVTNTRWWQGKSQVGAVPEVFSANGSKYEAHHRDEKALSFTERSPYTTRAGAVQRRQIVKGKMNIVGETHPHNEKYARRLEQQVCKALVGGKYWKEEEFVTKEGYADPPIMRAEERQWLAANFLMMFYEGCTWVYMAEFAELSKLSEYGAQFSKRELSLAGPEAPKAFETLTKKTSEARAIQKAADEMSAQKAKLAVQDSISQAKEELKRAQRSEEDPSASRVKCGLELVEGALTAFHSDKGGSKYGNLYRICNSLQDCAGKIGKLDEARTVCMYNAYRAASGAGEVGVWKVGDDHIQEMLKREFRDVTESKEFRDQVWQTVEWKDWVKYNTAVYGS